MEITAIISMNDTLNDTYIYINMIDMIDRYSTTKHRNSVKTRSNKGSYVTSLMCTSGFVEKNNFANACVNDCPFSSEQEYI